MGGGLLVVWLVRGVPEGKLGEMAKQAGNGVMAVRCEVDAVIAVLELCRVSQIDGHVMKSHLVYVYDAVDELHSITQCDNVDKILLEIIYINFTACQGLACTYRRVK
jgi:hypothetical protein